MFSRKSPEKGSDAPETQQPGQKTSTPKPTEDLIAKPARPAVLQRMAEPRRPVPAKPADDNTSRLVVGRGIQMKAEITKCRELVIEGHVEGRADTQQFTIATDGIFNGEGQTDTADIAGRFDGKLVVRGHLIVRSGGIIGGEVRYGQVEIEAGGRISGDIQALADGE